MSPAPNRLSGMNAPPGGMGRRGGRDGAGCLSKPPEPFLQRKHLYLLRLVSGLRLGRCWLPERRSQCGDRGQCGAADREDAGSGGCLVPGDSLTVHEAPVSGLVRRGRGRLAVCWARGAYCRKARRKSL